MTPEERLDAEDADLLRRLPDEHRCDQRAEGVTLAAQRYITDAGRKKSAPTLP